MAKKPNLENLLRALGQSAREVATTLKKEGCTGKRGNLDSCPIAAYMKNQGYERVAATSSYIEADKQSVCPPPTAIRDFIMLFDNGAYPELCETNGKTQS